MKGDPNYNKNLKLIETNHDLIDQYFITTSPDIIKTKIPNQKLIFYLYQLIQILSLVVFTKVIKIMICFLP